MSFYRIPLEKDNTISTWSSISTLRELGNAGACQTVDVWARYREDKNLKYLCRFLGQVSITALEAEIAAGNIPSPVTDATVTCNLKFFNINHGDPQAYEFTLDVHPLSTQWSEGRGIRIDSFTTTGWSSWASASNTAAWTSTGGDYVVDSCSASQYFDSGFEDLNVNCRNMLNVWLSGASANKGFVVKMDGVAESLTGSLSTNTQWYRKSFHGRTTNYPNYAPYIQLEWTDRVTDDRAVGVFGSSMSLYLYNAPNAIYGNIDSVTSWFPGKVAISACKAGVSGVLSAYNGISTDIKPASAWTSVAGLESLTASWVKSGIYKVTFTLPSTAVLFNTFADVWSITSALSAAVSSISASFTPSLPATGGGQYVRRDMSLNVVGWPLMAQGYNNRINKDTVNTWRVFFWERPIGIEPLAQSEKNSISSIAASTVATYITTEGYYRILVDALEVVDVDWQKLGYDGTSNFFTLDMSNFARHVLYRLEFKIGLRGQTMIFDQYSYKFIVE